MGLHSVLTAIADTIRSKTGISKALRLDEMPEAINDVHEAGKQAEWNAYWDNLQNNGTACDYNNAFSGVSWYKERLKPKHKIIPNTGANSAREMFAYFDHRNTSRINMASITYDMIDLSNCTNGGQIYYMFSNAVFESVEIDLRSIPSLAGVFNNNNGGFIRNIKLKVNATKFTNCFDNAINLTELVFEDSIIAGNGLNLQWSTKLSKASITSIVNALSTITSGLSVTLSETAVNNAFTGGSTGSEWLALAGTRSNWTINLV